MAACLLGMGEGRQGKNKTQINISINYPATAVRSRWLLRGAGNLAEPGEPSIMGTGGASQCQSSLEGCKEGLSSSSGTSFQGSQLGGLEDVPCLVCIPYFNLSQHSLRSRLLCKS